MVFIGAGALLFIGIGIMVAIAIAGWIAMLRLK
jgi:hypothetical protein